MIRKSPFSAIFYFKKMYDKLKLCILFYVIHQSMCSGIYDKSSDEILLSYARNPAPDGHRCGVCPTYLQKICAYDAETKITSIYDNHCIMDMYNCLHNTGFTPVQYDRCVFFGNFAYVHGYKYEDMDYGEDHIEVKHSKKRPDFIDV